MMSRRAGEKILIGDRIEIEIAHIGRSRVRVGIRAPRDLPVIARELMLVREENRAAAGAGPEVEGRMRPARPKNSTAISTTLADMVIGRQEAAPKN